LGKERAGVPCSGSQGGGIFFGEVLEKTNVGRAGVKTVGQKREGIRLQGGVGEKTQSRVSSDGR